ncbi:MAG: endonuclease/exonuclease/phosphatase family protein [Candidatus Spyradosoma sp.]
MAGMASWRKIAAYAAAFAAGAWAFCALARCDALRDADVGGGALPAAGISAPEAAAPVPEKRAGTLRVASINSFNYLSTNRRTDDGVYKRRWAKPRSEREALRRLILAVNPDVLAVQEIGGRGQLDQLALDLEGAGAAFPHRVVLIGRDTQRHVALLSRLPFREIFRFPEKDAMSRGLLGAEVAAPGMRPVRVFTLHLKSKITRDESDPECAAERLAEARRARALLLRFGGNAFALLGDFNDEPESAPVRAFAEGGLLRRLDSRDSAGAPWTYSNSRYGYRSVFDHVFLSPTLRGEGRVADEALSRVRSPSGGAVSASDHRMVFCDVSFADAEAPPAPPSGP